MHNNVQLMSLHGTAAVSFPTSRLVLANAAIPGIRTFNRGMFTTNRPNAAAAANKTTTPFSMLLLASLHSTAESRMTTPGSAQPTPAMFGLRFPTKC